MPVFFIRNLLVLFAHVPRCAGTAIENYLTARFGELAFLDTQHIVGGKQHNWSLTSPQHVDYESFLRLAPESWVSRSFAVVRHPEDRILSVFLFQRDIECNIAADQSFVDWLLCIEKAWETSPYIYDNHPRRAGDLVPTGAEVFRLEDGLDQIIPWLDEIEGMSRGPRSFDRANEYQARLLFGDRPGGDVPDITPDIRNIIERIYKTDYDRFGYVLRSECRGSAGSS